MFVVILSAAAELLVFAVVLEVVKVVNEVKEDELNFVSDVRSCWDTKLLEELSKVERELAELVLDLVVVGARLAWTLLDKVA